jgi:hypothetical protein
MQEHCSSQDVPIAAHRNPDGQIDMVIWLSKHDRRTIAKCGVAG